MKRKPDGTHVLTDADATPPLQLRRLPQSLSLPTLHIPTSFTSITPLHTDASRDGDFELNEQCSGSVSFAAASRRGVRPVMQDCVAFSTSSARATFVLCDGH